MKKLAAEYNNWDKGLSIEKKDKFETLISNGYRITSEGTELLWSNFGFKWELYKYIYKNLDDFWRAETINTINKITELELEADNLSYFLKARVEDLKYKYISNDQAVGLALQDKDRNGFRLTLFSILNSLGILDEIINSDIEVFDRTQGVFIGYNRKITVEKLKSLMIRYQFLLELLFLKVDDKFLTEVEKNFNKDPKNPQKKLSYNKLFRDSSNAVIVKNVLEKERYTLKGIWNGNPGELACLFWVLEPILKPGKDLPRINALFNEFNVSEDSLTPNMKRQAKYFSYRDLRNKLDRLFSKILS